MSEYYDWIQQRYDAQIRNAAPFLALIVDDDEQVESYHESAWVSAEMQVANTFKKRSARLLGRGRVSNAT